MTNHRTQADHPASPRPRTKSQVLSHSSSSSGYSSNGPAAPAMLSDLNNHPTLSEARQPQPNFATAAAAATQNGELCDIYADLLTYYHDQETCLTRRMRVSLLPPPHLPAPRPQLSCQSSPRPLRLSPWPLWLLLLVLASPRLLAPILIQPPALASLKLTEDLTDLCCKNIDSHR